MNRNGNAEALQPFEPGNLAALKHGAWSDRALAPEIEAEREALLQGILTLPEFAWELFLGVYCAIWGSRRESPILQADAGAGRATPTPAAEPA